MEEKKESPRYRCAECGVAVIIFNGVIHRPCPHKEAGVTAECSVTCRGESVTKGAAG